MGRAGVLSGADPATRGRGLFAEDGQIARFKINGACHCGKVSFAADIDPANVVICHCTDCQTFSSAPYRVSVPVLAANFTLRGEPSIYVKTADSGNRRAVAFCGTCGSALYTTSPDDPKVFNLRLGVVNQRAQLPPMAQGFCDSALAWASDIRSIRKIPRRPTDD